MTDRTDNSSLPDVPSDAPQTTLFQRIDNWLTGDCRYTANREEGWFSMIVTLECGTARTLIDTNDRGDSEFVAVFTNLSVFVPALRRSAVAELLTRINCAHSLPALQIDMEDGEVRSRAAIDLVGKQIDEESFDRILSASLRLADRAYAAILSVAFGDVPPALAWERVRAAEERAKEGVPLQ